MTAAISSTKTSFAPVADARTRVLILGSLPGEVSLSRSEYYAHPRNQFWRLMEAVIGVALVGFPYEARLAGLLSAGVGLWDVVHMAERAGSLDASIRNHRVNALRGLAADLPSLRVLAFNGGAAFKLGGAQFGPDADVGLIPLPSSSPAYAAMPFERKLAEWRRLTPYLR